MAAWYRNPVTGHRLSVYLCEVCGEEACYGMRDKWRCREHVWERFLPGATAGDSGDMMQVTTYDLTAELFPLD